MKNLVTFLLCPFARFFQNPHHLSGVVFSRILTNMATLTWSGIILCNEDTLVRSGSRYAFVTHYVNENLLAAFFGTMAAAQLVALWTHRSHGMICVFGYALMTLGWWFVFWYNIVEPGPVYPSATSLSATVAFASLYAFLDGKEKPGSNRVAKP